MQIKNVTNDSADIYFYGDIVNSAWDKWTEADTAPEDVLAILEQAKDKPSLNIYVNSGGGSVFGGIAIYNILKRFQGFKTVYVDALAGSIASVIAMVGDRIIIPSNSYLMIHKPWNMAVGNSIDFRKMADDLDRIEAGIMNVYAEKLKEGVDIATIQQMVDAETWLNGNEAAKYFNIEVSEANDIAACISDNFKNYINVPETLVVAEVEPEEVHSLEVVQVDEDEIIRMQMQLQLL
ncbi:Clp protease ClpP [Paenibacillus sp. 19GGS1-52]|uniref:head maturation protease, ClpP-related n=1 Tax=Paenibacillus sp. 19GGS1-52 TaxID=2758563 RepID=UPI001EFAA10B|nr:head maturation protease, ClpP-related [Paenibacillus sp. 19GGS1-52]ULO10333.1 Clp protease ClpP [Paenibacillus sp. 19GGS1-52]